MNSQPNVPIPFKRDPRLLYGYKFWVRQPDGSLEEGVILIPPGGLGVPERHAAHHAEILETLAKACAALHTAGRRGPVQYVLVDARNVPVGYGEFAPDDGPNEMAALAFYFLDMELLLGIPISPEMAATDIGLPIHVAVEAQL